MKQIKNAIASSKKKTFNLTDILHENILLSHSLRREYKVKELEGPSCSCNPLSAKHLNDKKIKYPDARCAIKIIMKEEGIKGFWKGLSMKISLQSMSTAISWSVYEFFKSKLIKKNFSY